MKVNDSHCHFFSPTFFAALARQRGRVPPCTPADICTELQWEDPRSSPELAERWRLELHAHGVARAVLIASVPGDETSVGEAVAQHPSRFVGFFMADPRASDAAIRARRALTDLGLRGLCLFPAMHHVGLRDERIIQLVQMAASVPGVAVFVHCGVLSVGVRSKLGLPSPFDLRLGDPLEVARLAVAFPSVPFVIPHFGAGMLREALMVADTCPNVYLDTSSSNRWIRYVPGLTLEAVFESALAVAGATRLLFGSDSSFFPRGWQHAVLEIQTRAVTTAGASDADAALIFGGNFDRLFPVSC